MKKTFVVITLLVFSFVVIIPNSLVAQVGEPEMVFDERVTEESTDSAIVVEEASPEIDSFELFWPVVAGRTRGDKLYFLKKLKEKIRGVLIFGKVKRADYETLIATKRVVEAEKLLSNGDLENATESLKEAREALEEVRENWEEVDDKGSIVKVQKDEINNKLNNLKMFLPYLADKYQGLRTEIDKTLEKVNQVDDVV